MARLWRAALVQRRARDRAGVVQLAEHAARDGGRGSYGHHHPGQEEVYFVISGKVTFKVGDDIFQGGPQTAVRMTGEEGYSVDNDTDAEAELLIFSTRLADAPFEKVDGFWP